MVFLVKKMDDLVRYDFSKEGIIKGVGLDVDKAPVLEKTRGRILQYHALMYITKGAGHFEDTGTLRRKVAPGTFFYLHPQQWHNFDPDHGTTWTEYWVLFDGVKTAKYFGSIIPTGQSFYEIGIDQEFIALYEDLYDVWFFQGKGFQEYSLLLLHEILAKAWLKINTLSFQKKNDWLYQVKKFLSRNISLPECCLQKFAMSENIGSEAFRKRFKKMTGFSPKQYFLMLKIGRAKELLLGQNERIKNIANNLGFDDPYYFSRLFRRKEGVSPRAYRHRHIVEKPAMSSSTQHALPRTLSRSTASSNRSSTRKSKQS